VAFSLKGDEAPPFFFPEWGFSILMSPVLRVTCLPFTGCFPSASRKGLLLSSDHFV